MAGRDWGWAKVTSQASLTPWVGAELSAALWTAEHFCELHSLGTCRTGRPKVRTGRCLSARPSGQKYLWWGLEGGPTGWQPSTRPSQLQNLLPSSLTPEAHLLFQAFLASILGVVSASQDTSLKGPWFS